MPKLTLSQIDDICWMHNFLNALAPEARPYFEWYFWEVSHGTIKLPALIEETEVDNEVWTPKPPPDMSHTEGKQAFEPIPQILAYRKRIELSTPLHEHTDDVVIELTSTSKQSIMTDETITPDVEVEETTEAAPEVSIPAEDENSDGTEEVPVTEEAA